MSSLLAKIEVGVQELGAVRQQFSPLLDLPAEAAVDDMRTAAACAMLHSFYTEIEKIFKLIATDWDQYEISADSWHKDLLNQVACPTDRRPAIISESLASILNEFRAFRHLFRGASIVLMRWQKLQPLITKVDPTYHQVTSELQRFCQFIRASKASAEPAE